MDTTNRFFRHAALGLFLAVMVAAPARVEAALELKGASAFTFTLETVDRSTAPFGLGKVAMVFGDGEMFRLEDRVYWVFRARRALVDGKAATDTRPLLLLHLVTTPRGVPLQGDYQLTGKEVAGLLPDHFAHTPLGFLGEAMMGGFYELGEASGPAVDMSGPLSRSLGTLVRMSVDLPPGLVVKATEEGEMAGRPAVTGNFKGDWPVALGGSGVHLEVGGRLVLDRETALPLEMEARFTAPTGVDFRYRLTLRPGAATALPAGRGTR